MTIPRTCTHTLVRGALAAAASALCLAAPLPAAAAGDDSADPRASWREEIGRTPLPSEGCFVADFPATSWTAVECIEAPDVPFLPASGGGGGAQTVGDGHDYAASSTQLITDVKGSFPSVSGVVSENDDGLSNDYSLQLNSDFMHTSACSGHPNCLSWQQFIYSSGLREAFIQYWLIDWDAACPSGWNTYGNSCFRNSHAVGVPRNSIKNLAHMSLYGAAAHGGNDRLTFTGPSHAYSLTAADSVLELSTGWRQAEFNIVGDGGGSEARFNSGSHVTVRALVHHGSTGVLSCKSNAGTTGETNNLNLGACSVVHGSNPYIQFNESN